MMYFNEDEDEEDADEG